MSQMPSTVPGTDPANPPEGQKNEPSPPQLPSGVVSKDGEFFIQAKVNGELREIPFTEAQIRLQKEVAADQRFQEAAEKQKELETEKAAHQQALKYWELSKKAIYQDDRDAGRQALALIGYEADELGEENEGEKGNSGKGGQTPPPSAEVDWSKAPPELQKAAKFMAQMEEMGLDPSEGVKMVYESAAEKIRNRVYKDLENAAQVDPALSQVLSKKDAKAKRVRVLLRSRIAERIGREGAAADAQTYNQVIREVKTELEELGTLPTGNPSDGSGTAGGPLPFPGMGPASSSFGVLNPLRPAERPKPVSPTAGTQKYGQNLLERWAFDLHEQGVL